MKSEMKKLLMGIGLLGIFILIGFISLYNDMKKAEKYVEVVEKSLESKDRKLIYLGSEECSYCAMLEPHLEGFQNSYEYEYEYIDTVKATSKLSEILNTLDIKEEEFGTPYLVVVEDGKIVDRQAGYVEENVLFDFLQKNNFIGKDEKMAINYLDYKQYDQLLDSDSKEIFVITQTGCSYCEQAKPVLEEVATKHDLDINIVNMSNFSEEEKTSFDKSLDYLSENQWGTPLILVVKDSKVLDDTSGLQTAEEYADFFKKNNLF